MIGYGEVVRHKAATIAEADQWWREITAQVVVEQSMPGEPLPGTGFVAFGSFAFDPDNSTAGSVLVVPQVIVGRRAGRAWRTTIRATDGQTPTGVTAGRLEERPDDLFATPTAVQSPGAVHYADGKLPAPEWQGVVAESVRRITAGELDKVVLARELLAIADNPVDPRWLVSRLAKDYPGCWTYHVDGLVGATPEMLIRREGGLATSRVLAGTIRRSADDVQDLALAAGLAQSGKDLQEHEFAVTSVARALAPFCSGMNVPDAPYVLELPNVLHLATDVTAVADPQVSSLALAAALHPSAAVCGTPTAAARATIAELEQLDRDRYAGPVGWIDADGDGEWAIALRCGRIDPDEPRQIRLYAGCGIVADSDPSAEHAESVAKLVPMRDALGG
jgi:menaquinone-specific isochorismate synthase